MRNYKHKRHLFCFFENCVAPDPPGGYTHPVFKTKDKTERLATLHVSKTILSPSSVSQFRKNFDPMSIFCELFQGLLSEDKLNIEKAQDRCIRVDKISKVLYVLW